MVTLQFLGGLSLLIAGAELLVRGASRLAAAVGLSPLVIGLTVVAFGTSAPELAVSVKASVSGQADVALGNVVGSNTFNVLAILGVASLIAPLAVSSQLVRLDVPVMVVASVLAWWLASDGVISRADGLLLASLFAAYTVALLRIGKQESLTLAQQDSDQAGAGRMMLKAAAAAVIGLGMLVVGARLLVDAAVAMATAAGVSEVLIGLTIVAAGTSLPEVVTSVVASLRGERDIAVGNVVGSNLFNLLCVLGVAGMASPAGVPVAPAVLRFDLPVMTAAAALCLPIFFTRFTIDRWEGAVLLGLYVAYVGWLASSAM
ncbi:Inner membrane protein YrbG [Posidoniimonas corsicana]|uniref:Inner membrane protein YrbG n=1 Tax=Posidoniimonas corsicana TaxID=1938618 RepID=A0A5C5V6G7_9BACT|nr:calcium/sodium antiporter [Posidoniimonas corsicana]TWT33533.1 Inner membrane protein YrbG [Posidoniimonas corsicana]